LVKINRHKVRQVLEILKKASPLLHEGSGLVGKNRCSKN
jgi:hypothetical protein